MSMQAAELEQKFGIKDILRFEVAPGGLVRAVICTPKTEGILYTQGAHVAGWTPRGQHPVLFTSTRSLFEPGKPIRGGVPIAFPWFGPRHGGVPGPLHGFARIVDWTVESARLLDSGDLEIVLMLAPSEFTHSFGYGAFLLRFRVVFGASLGMELVVHNESRVPFTFEEALHTYFAVGDIERVLLTGLEGTTYADKTCGFEHKKTPLEPMQIGKETDQVHLNTESACVIEDPAWKRKIVVEKSGSRATVVWNPWVEKARTIPDLGPEEWREMICVETVNALENAVTVKPGASHTMQATIGVMPA